jgi:hypothetical protein
MLDFDNGEMSSDTLRKIQDLLPYNSYLYVSQNHMIPKDGHAPVEKLRLFIPLRTPIRKEEDRKIISTLFVRKFRSALDKSFMDRVRYFAHGRDEIESFTSGRGFLSWEKLPGYGGKDSNVDRATRSRKKAELTASDIENNTFRLDDKTRDEHGDFIRMDEVIPGQRIFCPICCDAPWRTNNTHNCKFFINRNNIPTVYCSSCDSRGAGLGKAGIYELHPDDHQIYYMGADTPFVFEDVITGFFYGREFNLQENTWRIYKLSSRDNVWNFCKSNKIPVPFVVPRLSYIYKFDSNKIVDWDQRYVNKYQPTELIQLLPVPGKKYECPKIINNTILHIVGNDEEMHRHFLRWLSYFIQNRCKMVTSFLFQGTEGTGKGITFDNVIAPIIGYQFCSQASQDRFNNQFNSILADFLLVMVNEVHIDADDRGDSTQQKIKQAITDLNVMIERKGIDARKEASMCTLLFATNSNRGVVIPYGDRRFNVCPRQEKPIRLCPWFVDHDTWKENVTRELPEFVRFLKTIEVNPAVVQAPIENEARKKLQAMSTTMTDDFLDAITRGDHRWITDMVYDDPRRQDEYTSAMRVLKTIRARGVATSAELCEIYNYVTNKHVSVSSFGKQASNRIGEPKSVRVGGRPMRGYNINWQSEDEI